MSRRGLRLTALLAGFVALLFAGRWFSALCADRWWAAEVSPASVDFLTDWHFLKLILDVTGVVLASAWFIGHFLVVYRAVGSVQVRRNVANLEIREALTPECTPGSRHDQRRGSRSPRGCRNVEVCAQVALAWQGVSYGELDPLLQRDFGLYVAQLPVWRAAHGFFFLLEGLGLGTVFGLYLLVGAVRWIESRPAINSHARIHLGWLLVGFALVLMWGYLLEPYELLAGLDAPPDQAQWRAVTLTAPLLAGVAMATAVLSAAWALRARHALAAAGWIVLVGASLVGHWMVPPAMSGAGESLTDAETRDRIDRAAYGFGPLSTTSVVESSPPEAPRLPSLWNPATIARAIAEDSTEVLSIAPAILPVRNGRHPVWLAARQMPGNRLSLVAIADDRTGPTGEPLFFHSKDSVAVTGADTATRARQRRIQTGGSPLPTPRPRGAGDADLPVAAARDAHLGSPGGPSSRTTSARRPGRLGAGTGRSPSRLAPFVSWGTRPACDRRRARLVSGRLSRDAQLPALAPGRVARPQDRLAARQLRRDRCRGRWNDSNLSETRRQSARRGMGSGVRRCRGAVAAIPMSVLRAIPYPIELLTCTIASSRAY